MSLFARISLVFIASVLAPTVLIGSYAFTRAVAADREREAAALSSELAKRVAEFESRIGTIEDIAHSTAQNSIVQEFLAADFAFNETSLLNYRYYVYNLMAATATFNRVNIDAMVLFYSNPSIPEYWPYFMRAQRLGGELSRTRATGGVWIHPPIEQKPAFLDSLGLAGGFSLFRAPIETAFGELLGHVVIGVRRDRLFSDLRPPQAASLEVRLPDGEVFQEGEPLSDPVTLTVPLTRLTGTITVTADRSATVRNPIQAATSVLTTIILGFIVLEGVLWFVLRRLFGRLRSFVGVMDSVADGNLTVRIPQSGDDEVARLAHDLNVMIGRINDLVNETVRRETAQRDAQLLALQNQMDPHFIYNSLELLRMQLLQRNQVDLSQVIADFADLVRYNSSSHGSTATLSEEIAQVRRYVNLQGLRQAGRVELVTRVDPDCHDTSVPRFLLQPIVENSLIHGRPIADRSLQIAITCESRDERLVIVVTDDGAGIPSEKLGEIRHRLSSVAEQTAPRSRIGLANIALRLRLLYGDRNALDLRSEEGTGTTTTIFIPHRKGIES